MRMKSGFSVGLTILWAATSAFAQQASPKVAATPKPTAQEAIAAFSVKQPDEGSPFFSDRELAKSERAANARGELFNATGPNQMAVYPKVRDSQNNAGAIFTGFFTNMFSSVKLGKLGGQETINRLQVEPTEFSLGDRREVEVTYSVSNNTKKIMRLDYPTAQRVEILTTGPNGEQIDRWSDDRAFEPQEGIVIINPGERIEYSEKIPTRDMKPGEVYTISGEVSANPGFEAGRQVTPNP